MVVEGVEAPESGDDALLARARAVRENAYAPYSRFAVGAAVVGASGAVYVGCNVENASYSHTVCAERAAAYAAVAAGEKAITRVVVVTDTVPPASPCGACRQVLFELGPDATVVYANLAGEQVVATIRTLLPDGFEPGRLLNR